MNLYRGSIKRFFNKEGFTMREIEKLKDEPKSTVARKLNRIEALDE